ncbi:Cryptochrome-1 [Tetrabaena socialis]|uniref:Cryptochrome-1 n=1 Tax=Tetrabaena socialis TaxID=47790 RepID=A0A2J8A5J4_9CHLO|nr:Cryptochrome-1 [Tetrabaena socialis]|eukprot:PNH07791.1 Cryptochrome-1 [Tetrabaena socialis]
MPEFGTVIVWFRRDLRVDDNPALVAALNAAENVIPVFIWAPEEEGQFQPGRCSRWWTKHSLIDLQQALAALGSKLVIRRSTDSTAALLQIVSEVGAEAVFFNHLYDPISLMRDHDCKRGLTAAGVAQRTFNGDMLYEPWEVLDDNKQPLSTFSDFWARGGGGEELSGGEGAGEGGGGGGERRRKRESGDGEDGDEDSPGGGHTPQGGGGDEDMASADLDSRSGSEDEGGRGAWGEAPGGGGAVVMEEAREAEMEGGAEAGGGEGQSHKRRRSFGAGPLA